MSLSTRKIKAKKHNYSLAAKDVAKDIALLKRYGLTLIEYNELFDAQLGRCAICQQEENCKRLSVDHCHKTGKVRGLLCFRCNTAVGLMKDDFELCSRMSAYLK